MNDETTSSAISEEERALEARAKKHGRPVEVQRVLESRQEQALEDVLGNLRAGVEFYESKRRPNDPDLVQLFRNELLKKGIARSKIELYYDESPHIVEARDRQPHAQMFQINRWLNEQLYLLTQDGVDTRALRFSILNTIQVEEWMRLAMPRHATMIADHNLPR